MDNLIDYLFVYIYAGNDDWPGNNMKFWRVTEEAIDPTVYGADGKWRFMIHDFDLAHQNINHETLYLSTIAEAVNTNNRNPKYATDLFEGLFKNEDFRNEFAQRSMVYLRTIASGESVSGYIDTLAEEREAGKSADVARWNLGSLQSWKNNLNGLKNFASGRVNKLRSQYTDVFNTYYHAGITGTVLMDVSGDDCYVSGVKIEDERELKMFSGIPVVIEAENSHIYVEENGFETEGYNLLEFTPTADCSVRIEQREGIISVELENDVLSVVVGSGEGKLYIAGYNKDDTLKFVKSATIESEVFSVEKAYCYKVFIWNNMEPMGEVFEIILKEDNYADIGDTDIYDEYDNITPDFAEDDFDSETEFLSIKITEYTLFP